MQTRSSDKVQKIAAATMTAPTLVDWCDSAHKVNIWHRASVRLEFQSTSEVN